MSVCFLTRATCKKSVTQIIYLWPLPCGTQSHTVTVVATATAQAAMEGLANVVSAFKKTKGWS